MLTGTERRNTPRYFGGLRVRLAQPGGWTAPDDMGGWVVDVSAGGMQVLVENELPRGARLRAVMPILDGEHKPAVLGLEVVWLRRNPVIANGRYSAGLRYDPPDQPGAGRILNRVR